MTSLVEFQRRHYSNEMRIEFLLLESPNISASESLISHISRCTFSIRDLKEHRLQENIVGH